LPSGRAYSLHPVSGSVPWTSFGSEIAARLDVRALSYENPLELTLHLPAVLIGGPTLGFLLYAFKRIWHFPLELRLDRARYNREIARAERDAARFEAEERLLEDTMEALALARPKE
jgi:hypothetical protein